MFEYPPQTGIHDLHTQQGHFPVASGALGCRYAAMESAGRLGSWSRVVSDIPGAVHTENAREFFDRVFCIDEDKF